MAVTKMAHQQRTTITLPEAHFAAVRKIADQHFHGNFSAAVRELIETHPVTKSVVPPSPLAT
jgi:hypothetical protein